MLSKERWIWHWISAQYILKFWWQSFMTRVRTLICACRALCIALRDCNKTTNNKLVILMDNTLLQLESVILGLQALSVRATEVLVKDSFPPAWSTESALLPLQSSSCWTVWSGPGILHTVAVSLGSVQEPTLQGIQKTDQYGFQRPSPHWSVFDLRAS